MSDPKKLKIHVLGKIFLSCDRKTIFMADSNGTREFRCKVEEDGGKIREGRQSKTKIVDVTGKYWQ